MSEHEITIRFRVEAETPQAAAEAGRVLYQDMCSMFPEGMRGQDGVFYIDPLSMADVAERVSIGPAHDAPVPD